MAERYTALSEITTESKIRVRIIQVFKKTTFPGASKFAKGALELVLMDENQNKIEAHVRSYLIWKWVNVLKEFACITVSGFGIIQARGVFRFARNMQKISFLPGTIVTSCDIPNIPKYGFQFVDFANVLANNLEPHFLIDVIGELIEYGDVQSLTRDDVIRQMLTIKLADHSNNILRCTLWGEFAMQMSSFLNTCNEGRVIVILQFAKLGMFHDEIYISNAYFGTRLILDQSLPESIEFKQRGAEIDGDQTSRTISHVSGSHIQDVAMQFLQPGSKKMLSEIQGDVDKGVYVTLATIVAIEDKLNWFYNSCKKCKRGVETDGENFFCLYCEKQVDFAIPRYRLQVKVSDATGCSSFVMFDNDVQTIVHKSVATLRDELIQAGKVDEFPELLNVLLGKTYLFRYEISDKIFSSKGYKTHTIKKMTADEEIIKQFMSGPVLEVTSEFAGSSSTNDGNGAVGDLITPQKQHVPNISVVEQEDLSTRMSSTNLLKSVNKGKMVADAYNVNSFNDAIISHGVCNPKADVTEVVINDGASPAIDMVTPQKRSIETIEVFDEETKETIMQYSKLLKPVKIEKIDI